MRMHAKNSHLERQHSRQGGLVRDLEDPVRPATFFLDHPVAHERVLNDDRVVAAVDVQGSLPHAGLALTE